MVGALVLVTLVTGKDRLELRGAKGRRAGRASLEVNQGEAGAQGQGRGPCQRRQAEGGGAAAAAAVGDQGGRANLGTKRASRGARGGGAGCWGPDIWGQPPESLTLASWLLARPVRSSSPGNPGPALSHPARRHHPCPSGPASVAASKRPQRRRPPALLGVLASPLGCPTGPCPPGGPLGEASPGAGPQQRRPACLTLPRSPQRHLGTSLGRSPLSGLARV